MCVSSRNARNTRTRVYTECSVLANGERAKCLGVHTSSNRTAPIHDGMRVMSKLEQAKRFANLHFGAMCLAAIVVYCIFDVVAGRERPTCAICGSSFEMVELNLQLNHSHGDRRCRCKL